MVTLALVGLLLRAAPATPPPVPSDCEAEQTQDLSQSAHLPLFFVDARCAGERVAYLCSATKCRKNPCGGFETAAPRLLQATKGSASGKRASHRARKPKKTKAPKESPGAAAPKAAEVSGDALALLLHGDDDTLQVVRLTLSAGEPGCHPLTGLDQVLVDATNKGVKIGETLGKSGARDAIHGSTVVLTRGLYVGGDAPGGPSHGYLVIRAKVKGNKLKLSGATRKSADAVRFGRR